MKKPALYSVCPKTCYIGWQGDSIAIARKEGQAGLLIAVSLTTLLQLRRNKGRMEGGIVCGHLSKLVRRNMDDIGASRWSWLPSLFLICLCSLSFPFKSRESPCKNSPFLIPVCVSIKGYTCTVCSAWCEQSLDSLVVPGGPTETLCVN